MRNSLLLNIGLGIIMMLIPISVLPEWQDAHPTPMKAPPFLGKQLDPDTGYAVWRLGGSQQEMGEALPYPDGNEALGMVHAQHFYSRTIPVNSDETYVLGSGGQQQPYAALWRLQDKKLVAWVPTGKEAHVQQRQLLWDRIQPDVYWFTEGNCLIRVRIDFASYQVKQETWDCFKDFGYITFGLGEGNFSDDGSKVVLVGKYQHDGLIYLLPYSIQNKQAHSRRALTSPKQPEVDWAGVDPTGKYIVFDRQTPRLQTVVVPFESASKAEPRVLYNHAKHSDFILDVCGEPWTVYGNWQGVFAVRLRDSKKKKLWSEGASGHIARVAGKPGYVLLSRHQDGGLYLLEMGKPEAIRYLGNSRHGYVSHAPKKKAAAQRWGVTGEGEVTFYKREARGAIAPSGRYVFFVSDYHVFATSKGGYAPEPVPGRAFLNMIEIPD